MLRSLFFSPEVVLLKVRNYSSSSVASRVREIVRMALKDPESATVKYEKFSKDNDVPDWGAIKMASVLMSNPGTSTNVSTAEKVLHDQYKETGDRHRFARKAVVEDEQIEAALARVINGDVERARKFYRLLLDLRFCSNKDSFISLFVRKRLESGDLNSAVEELKEWLSVARHKSITQSLLMIVQACKTKEETDLVSQFVRSQVPKKTADLLFGFDSLCRGKGSELAEQLHREGISLGQDGARFICQLAGKTKQFAALQSLLMWNILFKMDEKSRALVYEELVKIYGKKDDMSALDTILVEISKEQNCMDHYDKPIMVARHFYRCLNRQFPEELFQLRERPRRRRQPSDLQE